MYAAEAEICSRKMQLVIKRLILDTEKEFFVYYLSSLKAHGHHVNDEIDSFPFLSSPDSLSISYYLPVFPTL